MSNDYLGDPRGFCFVVEDEAGPLATMGEQVMWAPRLTLEVRIPRPGRIRLLRNGRLLCFVSAKELRWPAARPGVYRVEVERRHALRWKPWLFSNPIYLRPGPVKTGGRARPGARWAAAQIPPPKK